MPPTSGFEELLGYDIWVKIRFIPETALLNERLPNL